MILFCDTSALMKLYAQEDHSERMRDLVKRASTTLVSLLTWVEMHAAFGRKQRTQQSSQSQTAAGLRRLREEWDNFTRIGVDAQLITDAGEFALRFGLRAYDSVQLASAQRAQRQLSSGMMFCCFDRQLNSAATSLAMPVLAH